MCFSYFFAIIFLEVVINMKKAVVIVNLHSGMKRRKKEDLENFTKIFEKYDYEVKIFKTKYPTNAVEIVESLPDDIDLVISMGGDGTFNEIVTGNLNRKKRLVLSHIPYGTTNDVGAMFSLGKNKEKSLNAILSGETKKIDVCSINDHIFVYVAGFGKFMNVPYETPRKLKKKIGYFAYLIEGVKDFFRTKTRLYDITYEVDGTKQRGLYSFALISNANRIAGIKNFYKDVKLDDKKFEVLFCNIQTKKDIVRSLFGLRMADITKIPGFYFYKTDNLRITFHDKLKKPWCLDGEEYPEKDAVYEIKVVPDIEMLLPSSVSKELFTNGE